jgi:hypothetical protein
MKPGNRLLRYGANSCRDILVDERLLTVLAPHSFRGAFVITVVKGECFTK